MATEHISIRDMLEAGAHFGHQTQRWNPKMRPYIYEARNGVHIINLKKTLALVEKAYAAVRDVAASGDSVMFVGTKLQSQEVVREEAKRCGMFYVTSRWLGGTLTNFVTIKHSIDTFNSLEKMHEEESYQARTKKEALLLDKKRVRMAKNFEGLAKMTRLPGAMFVIDPVKDDIAVDEAHRLGIPVIALSDTNSDPEQVDYPIPANDDALRSIKLFTHYIAEAAIEGRSLYESQMHDVAAEAAAPDAPHRKGGPQGPQGPQVRKARLGKRDERRGPSDSYSEPAAAKPAPTGTDEGIKYEDLAEDVERKTIR